MFRPKLTRLSRSHPLSGVIENLNRAVSDQANIRPGDGLGLVAGPFGRTILPTASNFMIGKTDADGIPEATDDGGKRNLGRGVVYPAGMEFDGAGFAVKFDDSRKLDAYNLALDPVGEDKMVILLKIASVWVVIWEECPESGA